MEYTRERVRYLFKIIPLEILVNRIENLTQAFDTSVLQNRYQSWKKINIWFIKFYWYYSMHLYFVVYLDNIYNILWKNGIFLDKLRNIRLYKKYSSNTSNEVLNKRSFQLLYFLVNKFYCLSRTVRQPQPSGYASI